MTFASLRTLGIRCAIAAVMASQMTAARCEDSTITIDNFTFTPAELTVKVGTTVTWKNQDDIPHQVESPGYRRQLLVHLHHRRRLQVLLFAASAHDGDDQG
jgi:plastocyanin